MNWMKEITKPQHKIKQQYHDVLKVEMHRIQRLPSLLYTVPFKTLDEINLQLYERLVNEPLHDVSNQIKNIQQKIPYHVDKAIKKKAQDVIISSFNNKDAKNSADYRRSLLMITNWFQQELPNHFTTQISKTLSEIQELLYLPDNKRNPATILKLIITTYKHAMFLKVNIDGNIRSMTDRKLFGIYYYSIMGHSAEQFRLYSDRSTNTEKEEATFNTLKIFTNITSNHHTENIIFNAIVRSQAKEKFEGEKVISSQSKAFKVMYNPIKEKLQNSLISFDWIEKHPWDYQALLEQLADYLLENSDLKWWTETEKGILFFDNIKKNDRLNCKTKMHHFRSSSIKTVSNYVHECWLKCLNDTDMIPAYKIKVLMNSGIHVLKLSTLKHFQNKCEIHTEDADWDSFDTNSIGSLSATKL